MCLLMPVGRHGGRVTHADGGAAAAGCTQAAAGTITSHSDSDSGLAFSSYRREAAAAWDSDSRAPTRRQMIFKFT